MSADDSGKPPITPASDLAKPGAGIKSEHAGPSSSQHTKATDVTADETRRDFLKITGAAFGGSALGSVLVQDAWANQAPARTEVDQSSYDVIVVGGGFAGATAARELSAAGMRVLLLEARPRLGGRTFTSKFADHKVELGGTWIHWLQPYVWAEMHRYGLGVVESPVAEPTQGIVLRADGTREEHDPLDMYVSMMNAFDQLFHDSMEHFPRPYDPMFKDSVLELDKQSITDRMDVTNIPEELRDMMTGIFGGMVGLDMSQGSATAIMKVYAASGWNFPAFMDVQSRYKIEGGTIALIDAMLKDHDTEVRLATPVEKIEQVDGKVFVTTDEEERISANAAVITIPRNTYTMVDFQPALSVEKMKAVEGDRQAKGIKVYAKLAQDVGQILAAGASTNPICFLQTEHHGPDGSIVIAFGASRDNLDINDGDAVAREIKRFLPDVEVLASTGYDWVYDPYSMGAWPAYAVGDLTTALKPLQKSEGNLFFAGAATANGWHEWIDGAIESGIRAAREIKETIIPS